MIWKSVVGKLWITIIGLVTIVLLSLSLFLTQYFDRFYYQQESKDLLKLANAIKDVLLETSNREAALVTVSQLIEGEDRNLELILSNSNMEYSPIAEILQDPRMKSLWNGMEVTFRGFFPIIRNGTIRQEDLLIVGMPITFPSETGIILLYESLAAVNRTTEGTKSLILYAAGFGIVLTTIFAFFLSTRISQPLMQMKEAAHRLAKGDFTSTVDIRTNDEIGELGATFNHMAKQLDDSIHLLSREKEQFASILRSMADGVISVNLDMEIAITNPMAEKFFVYWQYETSSLPEPLISMFRDCIEQEEEISKDVDIKGRTIGIVISPLYDRDTIRGAVAVFRDLTNERKLDKLRKDFVANVSHELRTPIAMLQGYSEAILDGVAETEEERMELAKIIYDESVRMGKLVNELLDFARMEAGHLQLHITEVNLDALVKKVLRKFHGIAKERKITLSSSDIPSSYPVYFDGDRMEQVLTNLIDNAIRHTPIDGNVSLSVVQSEKLLQIEVADTGSGIAAEDLPFVFERFYKADKARTRGRSGTGLGLSIVKNIVEAHHGHIFIQSTLNKGTTFIIQLPQEQKF